MAKTIEQHAAEKNTPDWLFAAAKAAHKWGQGKELDDAAYDAAVERTSSFRYHAYAPGPSAAPAPASIAEAVEALPDSKPVAVIDDRASKKR